MARNDSLDRYEDLKADFLGRPGVALGRSLHRDTLTVNGKLFASAVADGLLIKVGEKRVGELVESGAAILFRGSGGRVMREWAVVHPDSDWHALADESMGFVAAAAATSPKKP
jgi:hypothetical protein